MVTTQDERDKRKAVARHLIGLEMAGVYYNERNAALKESEAQKKRADELKRRADGVIKVAREIKHAREESLVEMLTGDRVRGRDYKVPRWIDRAAIRVAKKFRGERDAAKVGMEEMKKAHLSEKVEMIGGYERIERVPLIVYHKGDFIYETNMFDKMVRSTYLLQETMEKDVKFMGALNKGKKVSIKYEGGELFFVPEKLKKHDYVAIAYFVPGVGEMADDLSKDERKKIIAGQARKEKIFKRQGRMAAEAIYKTLKSYDKSGRDFMNDGN